MGKRSKTWPGVVACLLGLGFTGFNVFWALGNEWLADTVFPVSDSDALAGVITPAFQWAAIVLKTGAAFLGLVTIEAVARALPGRSRAAARVLAWAAAGILSFWGLTQIISFALAKAGFRPAPGFDWTERTIDWHVFLWDPWFLVWGVVLGYALFASRRSWR